MGHVAVAAKQANDPAARRDCHRRGLLFHLFIVGVLLMLLWLAYLGLKLLGGDDNDDSYGCPGCTYSSSTGSHYPWSLAMQLIATVGLLQSLVAHYVSTAPCRGHGSWNIIVIGNLANAIVFIWMVWLISAITSPGPASAWPLVVTLFAAAAACIVTAASWLFCSPQEIQTKPCQDASACGP